MSTFFLLRRQAVEHEVEGATPQPLLLAAELGPSLLRDHRLDVAIKLT